MDARPTRRKAGETKSRRDDGTTKKTLTLSVDTARRLGVEAAMRQVSESAIAEEVLSKHLRRWRLPSVVAPESSGGSIEVEDPPGKGKGLGGDEPPVRLAV